MSIGWQEVLLIVIFIVVVFGAKRIPDLARALGRASYEFKKAKNDLADAAKDDDGTVIRPEAAEKDSDKKA